MNIFNKLFGKTEKPNAAPNKQQNLSEKRSTTGSQPKFVRKDVQSDGTVYEMYKSTDGEAAKTFLALQKVAKKYHYIVVETPDGNWGTDIQGLYLERILEWQTDTNLAQCEGIAQPYSIFGLEMAEKGINDNFIAKILCGKCDHNWLDGIRYKSTTIVKCPNCKAYNKVDSNNIVVIPSNTSEMVQKFQSAIRANVKKDFEQAYSLFKECYENNYSAAECAGILGLIAFNGFSDIEKARIWFTRAAKLGSQDNFVYLYLVEIYQANNRSAPKEYFDIAFSGNTRLTTETINKIKALINKR